ncbi:MAG: hypothetical protein H7A49_02375 [Akkermansiaceae bacterium]|nr:hypothetical protein [Akkermansiaceae bacterium]MCP5542733.1 hypothetical protein [Akkermansiaceae bacterium]
MSRVRRLLLAGLAALLTLASCGREKHETAAPTTEARKAAPASSGPVSPTAALDETIDALAGAEPRETLEDLATLRAGLEAAGDAAAADAIARFLRSGRDAPTRLGFGVGPEGVLARPPTFRTALMNWLPAFDPDAALDMARATIAAAESPDECALALRNIAWNDFEGDLHEELAAAFERVMTRPGWSENPTSGFLESLDIAVELGDREAFDFVGGMMAAAEKAGNDALLRAAFITMDRMVIRHPQLLAGNADPLPPAQRAALMSRLDPSDATQREVLASYLEALEDPEETAEFTALFPNANQFQGNWLVTASEEIMSVRARWERDRAILAALDGLEIEVSGPGKQAVAAAREKLAPMVSGPPPE